MFAISDVQASEKHACMLHTCEDTTHSSARTMAASVPLSVVLQNSRLFSGWGWVVEVSVCEMLFGDNASFTAPDLSGCIPSSPIQRVTLSHKASHRWQWHVCAQPELWAGCLMGRNKMAQGGQECDRPMCDYKSHHLHKETCISETEEASVFSFFFFLLNIHLLSRHASIIISVFWRIRFFLRQKEIVGNRHFNPQTWSAVDWNRKRKLKKKGLTLQMTQPPLNIADISGQWRLHEKKLLGFLSHFLTNLAVIWNVACLMDKLN